MEEVLKIKWTHRNVNGYKLAIIKHLNYSSQRWWCGDVGHNVVQKDCTVLVNTSLDFYDQNQEFSVVSDPK